MSAIEKRESPFAFLFDTLDGVGYLLNIMTTLVQPGSTMSRQKYGSAASWTSSSAGPKPGRVHPREAMDRSFRAGLLLEGATP